MPIDTDKESKEDITPVYPNTYKDEIKKLRKKLKELGS
jgi:hypothetical protein